MFLSVHLLTGAFSCCNFYVYVVIFFSFADKIPTAVLYQKLDLDEITAVLRTRHLRWYGHVQRATSCINSVTPPGLRSPSVRALVRVRVSVTFITRRGSCGFCPSFVTTIYTRAHRRWWRVSTVQQLVRLDARNCRYRDYTRFHIRLKNHER